jgi:hypothetical protein
MQIYGEGNVTYCTVKRTSKNTVLTILYNPVRGRFVLSVLHHGKKGSLNRDLETQLVRLL